MVEFHKSTFSGKDILNLGIKPGPYFKDMLELANRLGRCEYSDLEHLLPPPKIPLFETPREYEIFISKPDKDGPEMTNYNAVIETMNAVMLTPTVVLGGLMPDACPAGSVGTIPVGGVVVTENAIHPGMHSADICCSVMLTNYGNTITPKELLDETEDFTHFGPGPRKDRRTGEPRTLPRFNELNEILHKTYSNMFLNTDEMRHAMINFMGTQGDGNHFAFVGTSQKDGGTCLVTHHGSRKPGAILYKKGMEVAEKFRRELSPDTLKQNAWIPFDTKEGQEYWEALQLIRDWTKYNHIWIHEVPTDKEIEYRFWNEHNFVFENDGYFYHAKGSTPVDSDLVGSDNEGKCLIPLNMASPVLVVDVYDGNDISNLGFAPHGAGREYSRSEHRRSQYQVHDHIGSEEEIIKHILEKETDGLDIRFYSGNPDVTELPSAYKSADKVIEEIRTYNLANISDMIMPYGCIMAGDVEKAAPWRKKKEIKEGERK